MSQVNAQGDLKPRILRLEIGRDDAGKTIKEYLMRKIGFSSRQLSRFKYRRDGILLNGVKRYVNAPVQEGDVLEIRLTRGGEAVEEHPHDALQKSKGEYCRSSEAGEDGAMPGNADSGEAGGKSREEYAALGDGRLQKIWAPPARWLSENFPLRILYEDQDILAADKPPGVVCHPSPGHYDDTLSNQVAEHLGRTGQELDVRVTGRLDRDTSGIVIFALNTETAAQLIKQRQAMQMQKTYIACVRGHFPEGSAGTVDRPLRRESPDSFRMIAAQDGKPARTHYRVLEERADGTSLILCRIEHGRTHQIRVHMACIGHPLAGDRLYGAEADLQAENTVPLMLHAWKAVLLQPFTGKEIALEAPLPDWAERREPGSDPAAI